MDKSAYSARDVLYYAFRQKWKVIALSVAIMVATILVTALSQKTYSSESKLLLRLGRENLSIDPSVVGASITPMLDRQSEINSEIAILKSRYLAERVVDAVGTDKILGIAEGGGGAGSSHFNPVALVVQGMIALHLKEASDPRQAAIATCMQELAVQVETKTNIISLSYEAPSPAVARDVLDQIVHLYLQRHIEVHSAQASPALIEAQAEKLHQELVNRENALEAFRQQNQIASIDRQRDEQIGRISALQTELSDTSAQIDASSARIKSIEAMLKKRSAKAEMSRTTGRPNNAADTIKQRMLDLKLKETDLAARYPDTHPPLIDVRKQIEETRKLLAQEEETHTEITTGIDSNFQQLQLALDNEKAQLKALQARNENLHQELTKENTSLAVLTGHEVDFGRMSRDVELADGAYRQYKDNLQRVTISAALDAENVSNLSIVEPATVPVKPVRPRVLLNLIVGLIVSLFASIGLLFLTNLLDDSVTDQEETEEYLGVPVLAVITESEFKACVRAN